MKKRTKSNTPGLYAKNFPKPVRWQVDFDYLDKLSPTEREWLARFSDEYHGAAFREGALHDEAGRRERYVAKNRANSDAYGIVTGSNPNAIADIQEHDVAGLSQDLEPTPEYLNTTRYKAALEAYRACLPRNNKEKFVPSVAADRARWKLDAARRPKKPHTVPKLKKKQRKQRKKQ